MKTCETMPDEDWLTRAAGWCYFYPGRDCPRWEPGGKCGRIGETIPADAEGMDTP